MEFDFDCEDLFNLDADGFVTLRGKELAGYSGFNSYNASVKFRQGERIYNTSHLTGMDKLCLIIDKVGCASSAVGGAHPRHRVCSR